MNLVTRMTRYAENTMNATSLVFLLGLCAVAIPIWLSTRPIVWTARFGRALHRLYTVQLRSGL